ncbi:hypothetical protein DPMN_031796 [Dreissena polymorpha]|uniref:Uncharacterized protein n=2 Tax=Dreissena polymorpha TaxID=45954 RepID=A0A9D4M2J4_DREPO|nr:hypothetical protein DPMN_031796 [Dreissena polymorpha]
MHDFYFVKRKFSVVDNIKTECIVVQSRQQKIEMAQKKIDDYRSWLQTTCISDMHLNKLWISTGDNRIYQLDIQTKTLTTAFITEGACYGFALFDGGFAIIVLSKTDYDLSEWQIKLFTRSGVLKGELADKTEKNLLKTPKYLQSNANEDILYSSDSGTNSVIAINSRGHVLFVFTSTSMFAPGSLAVDLEGNIYVACDQGVLQIHKDGEKSRLVLKLKDNKPGVQAVFFDRKHNCLVVLKDSKTASVFRFVDCIKNVSNASDFNKQE